MLISGYLYSTQCKWNLDNRYPLRVWNNRNTLKEGDSIFLKVCDIPSIFMLVPIGKKVILVIHNSDETFTDQMYMYLKPYASKIYAVNSSSNNVIKLPLGFRDNQYVSHSIIQQVKNEPYAPRVIPVLINFLIGTNPGERKDAFDYFKNKPFCIVDEKYANYNTTKALDFNDPDVTSKRLDFYRKLKQSHFAICPAGQGKDTHRLYECLYLGVIPIVKSSFLDDLYRNFPVWIVNDWSDVNEETIKNYKPFEWDQTKFLYFHNI